MKIPNVFAILLLLFAAAPPASAADELRFGILSVSSGVFVFEVLGPVGMPYRLESSTDLEEWTMIGEPGVAQGCDNPPAGFLYVAELGEQFFLRVVRLD